MRTPSIILAKYQMPPPPLLAGSDPPFRRSGLRLIIIRLVCCKSRCGVGLSGLLKSHHQSPNTRDQHDSWLQMW